MNRTILASMVMSALAVGCGADDGWGGGGPASFDGGERSGEGSGSPLPSAGQLTAGEFRDLDHWDTWLERDETIFDLDARRRVAVDVTSEGEPAIDVAVELVGDSGEVAYRARTNNHGRAELFAGALGGDDAPYSVRALDGDASTTATVETFGDAPIGIELAGLGEPDPTLDLMFVIDTTGSMSDELVYIQAELGDVIARARTESAQRFDLRTSVNFYRDEGDEYVVRAFPFESDEDAIAHLRAQGAGGGGDWPEAVDQALANAILEHEWSESARARLLFLVLDAPPHDGDQEIQSRIESATLAAAARGVRIIPVSGTGVDARTETLLRTFAILTNGTYTFLTNDSGIGGDHLDPDVPSYEVELLNDLLVRLIVESVE